MLNRKEKKKKKKKEKGKERERSYRAEPIETAVCFGQPRGGIVVIGTLHVLPVT
jgi:hypothetical protein